MIVEKKVPFSYILNKVRYDLLFVLALSILINLAANRFTNRIPEMPLSVAAFLGTAISILLSFKLSQSYDRWWEARKVWGAIVNDSRSLILQLQQFAGTDAPLQRLAHRQIAWCYVLGRSLRGQPPLDGIGDLLQEAELERVATHRNMPLALLRQHGADLRALQEAGQLSWYGQVQLDATLVRLTDAMGKAERINGTVFPVTYRLFLHYAIYLFVVVLSIALKDVAPVFEIPLLVLIASVFFLLEKSAFHLQDPFRNRPSDIPVTAIARTIEINIRQLMGEADIPGPATPEGFYLL
ncbi:bestrophin family protein [Flaviaesturariibacter amylovorans]|uniref:Bestrophin family protein n=1 Tax=Flaviaesturariibacter amylovorans TaxID=1084520 RepID=A0ABP8HDP3_9BACT